MSVEQLAEAKRRRRRARESDSPATPPTGTDGKPDNIIQMKPGELHHAIDQAEQALLAAGYGPIFQRGGLLVQIADRPARRSDGTCEQQHAIIAVGQAALLEQFGRVTKFEKWDVRAGDWRRIDPPGRLAEAYLARGCWRVADLHQSIGTPTQRPDGTLLSAQGYDPATGLYLTADLPGLAVPDRPTRQEAEDANEALVRLFDSFPFVQDPPGQALAVALAGLLGAVLRPTLPTCPIIGVTAPQAGTGKSYLVDLISLIATGRRATSVATGSAPEELEKSIGAALLEGRPLLSLDNMAQALGGQLLCMIPSQERVAVRILGQSRSVDVPTSAALFATGNALRIQGDMTRRVLLCRLDAGLEHPEERIFDADLLAEVRRRRAELVSAALTILRWYHCDPAPQNGRPFAGFGAWCARVRDPLLALGHTDPVGAIEETRATDMDAARLETLIEAWRSRFDEMGQTCADAIAEASRLGLNGAPAHAELADAIAGATGERRSHLSSRRLGNYLARNEGRIAAGYRFLRAGKHAKIIHWRLEPANKAGGYGGL